MMIRNMTALGVLAMGLTSAGAAHADADGQWASAGHDLRNSRYQAEEEKLSTKTVGGLQKKWELNTSGDVTASPAVDGNFLYFPDSAGFLYKVNGKTGALVWKKPVSDYTGIAGDTSRATPAVSGSLLIYGNQAGKLMQFGQPNIKPGRVFALNKNTGAPVWSTIVDDTAYAIVTQSPIVAKGKVYVGVASNEELWAGFIPKAYWQWAFRGSVVALDLATGAKKWQTFTVPEGYYGGSVWGSTGAVDLKRNTVYMATGDNFWAPASAQACAAAAYSNHTNPLACMPVDNYFDAVVALDLDTGKIKWGKQGLPYDVWNVGCGLNIPGVFTVPPNDNCPNPKGPDFDYAQGPMLLGGVGDDDDDKHGAALVGAGQKSGMYWAFDADSGAVRWATQAGPPGLTGGLQWGSAFDGQRVYVAVANSGLAGAGQNPFPWALKGGGSTTAGGWSALNAKTGAVLWTTADPLGSRAEGAVGAANGVVFGCNLDAYLGTMYALDAKTGKMLWSFNAGPPTFDPSTKFYSAACSAAPSISDGMVFWGTGTNQGFGPKKVFGFGL